MCVTWLIHVCDMTYSHVWHDAFMSHDVSCPMVAILRCVTWLIHVCDLTHSCVWHDVFMCVTWRIYESWCELPHGGHSEVCDMTHSCVWRWLIHVCDMTHSCVWHDSFMCVTWLIYMCDMIGWQGLPFTSVKPCLKFRGLPWNPVWKLRGQQRKLVWNFGSRKYFKSDLLRPWIKAYESFMNDSWAMRWMAHVTNLRITTTGQLIPRPRTEKSHLNRHELLFHAQLS